MPSRNIIDSEVFVMRKINGNNQSSLNNYFFYKFVPQIILVFSFRRSQMSSTQIRNMLSNIKLWWFFKRNLNVLMNRG